MHTEEEVFYEAATCEFVLDRAKKARYKIWFNNSSLHFQRREGKIEEFSTSRLSPKAYIYFEI